MKNLPNNYRIVHPNSNESYACACDKAQILPAPESYPTLEEAIDRLQMLFEDVAKNTFHPLMASIPGAVSVRVALWLDLVRFGEENTQAATKEKIIDEFKSHPSVPLIGIVKFFETSWCHIICCLQGQKEIEKWIKSPDAKELCDLMKPFKPFDVRKLVTPSGIEIP